MANSGDFEVLFARRGPTVMKRISEKATLIKENIKEAMAKVQHVATTTDCWTAHRRSFLGVTSHWLDEETLERKSAALASLV